MHWTALLRDRTLPPNARVARDLPCVSCGYNLYRAPHDGNCPECGTAVRRSIVAATQPHALGETLRHLVPPYAVLALAAVFCMTPMISLVVMSLCCVFRMLALASGIHRGSLRYVPRAQQAAWALLIAMLAEMAVVVALMAVIMIDSASRTALDHVVAVLFFALPAVLLAQVALIGLLGRRLAEVFRYPILFWEAHGLMIGAAICGVVVVIGGAAGSFIVATPADVRGILHLLILITGAPLYVGVLVHLLHLANAAERARETEEELLESAG